MTIISVTELLLDCVDKYLPFQLSVFFDPIQLCALSQLFRIYFGDKLHSSIHELIRSYAAFILFSVMHLINYPIWLQQNSSVLSLDSRRSHEIENQSQEDMMRRELGIVTETVQPASITPATAVLGQIWKLQI
ncbi:Hypothetical_protein [Hexamita inflata]|uniref:Hypothetical_protein n=1 Tax=Hexamita inflata TaxID=28002 RepID=A0AA86U3G4_9EUKA|nr:Hypothetical protein HINF_LOCUS24227 [Hexamita inflata]